MAAAPASLRQRLLVAETDFLAVRDDHSLHVFADQWTTLCDEFQQAYDNGLVDEDLEVLAHQTFSRIAILGETCTDLEKIAANIQDSLMNELDSLFSELSVEDIFGQSPHAAPRDRRSVSARVPRRRTHTPHSAATLAYIPAAYDWLLDNLHYPYPSESTKKALAQQANVKLHALKEWFSSVRKRIGWETICKTRFEGRRPMARTVAEAIFSGDEGDLKIPFEIASEFLAMRSKAQSLFATERALESDSSVTDASPSPSVWPDTPSSSDSQLSPSRPPSLVFSLGDSESDDDKLPESSPRAEVSEVVTPVKSRKRSRPVEDDLETSPTLPTQIEAHLSSPSKPLIGEAKHDATPSNSYASSSRDLPIANPRKRCWSDSDSSHPSKRSRTERNRPPRPQVVSAPVMQSSIDLSASFTSSSFEHTFDSVSSMDACFPQYPGYLDNTPGVNNLNFFAFDGSSLHPDLLLNEGLLSMPEVIQNAPSSTTLRMLPLPDQVQLIPSVSDPRYVAAAPASEDFQPETTDDGSESLASFLSTLPLSLAYPQPVADIDNFLHELDLVPELEAVPELGTPQDWDHSLTDVAPPTQIGKLGWEDVVGNTAFPAESTLTPSLPQTALQEPENVGAPSTPNFDSLVQEFFGDSDDVSALLQSPLSIRPSTTNEHQASRKCDWLAPPVPALPLLSTSSQ